MGSIIIVRTSACLQYPSLDDGANGRHAVLGATDGCAALDIVTRTRVALILLDIQQLSGLDGLTVLERLRDIDRRIPLMVVGGIDSVRVTADALQLGTTDDFTRPCDDELLLLIRRALDTLPAAASMGNERHLGDRHLHPAQLLLVGGDFGTRGTLTLALSPYCHIDLVASPAAALAYRRRLSPDVILLDASMPGTDVADFLTRLRATFVATPLIAINVVGDPRVFIDALRPRLHAALGQPLQCEALFDALRNVLTLAAYARRVLPIFSRPVTRVMNCLLQNYATIRICEIGKAVGISGSHLRRLFREETGMPLKRYLDRLRLEIAKYWLAETDETLETIARHIGLQGAPHFSRVFLRVCGERPGAYRRLRRSSRRGTMLMPGQDCEA